MVGQKSQRATGMLRNARETRAGQRPGASDGTFQAEVGHETLHYSKLVKRNPGWWTRAHYKRFIFSEHPLKTKPLQL